MREDVGQCVAPAWLNAETSLGVRALCSLAAYWGLARGRHCRNRFTETPFPTVKLSFHTFNMAVSPDSIHYLLILGPSSRLDLENLEF